MTGRSEKHLADSRLAELGRHEPLLSASPGQAPAPELGRDEAEHVARCARCRATLARHDPTALFGLLAVLPAAEAVPARASLPPRRGLARAHRARRAAIATLAAAAALIAGFSLLERPEPESPWLPAPGLEARARPGVVRRVHSDSATVVTLLPTGGQGPTVTLIIDEGIDL